MTERFVRGFSQQAEDAEVRRRLAAKPKCITMYLKPGEGLVHLYCPHCKIDFYLGKGHHFCPRCTRDVIPWSKAKKVHGWE